MGGPAPARPFRVDADATAAGLIAPLAASAHPEQAEELGAAEQLQKALELASMGGGGVEVAGKAASIKSISDHHAGDVCGAT